MRRFLWRIANLFRKRAAEREMKREIASHLALLQEEFEHQGLAPEEAALAARHAYGGVEQSKELHREARSFVWVEQFFRDLLYSARGLARTPAFTLTAVAALALGIGLNAMVFRMYDAIALKPLPVADPDRVVRVERWFEHHWLGDIQYNFAYSEYEFLRDHNTVFSGLAAATHPLPVSATVRGLFSNEPIHGFAVSANYFAAMGIRPLLGRTFLPDEDRLPGGNPVVVIGYSFWQQKLRADPAALGQSVKLNGTAYTVIGVAQRNFTGTALWPIRSDFWAPLSMIEQLDPNFGADWRTESYGPTIRSMDAQTFADRRPGFQILARLKDRIPRKQAQAETDALMRGYLSQYRQTERTRAVTLQATAYFPNTDDIRFQAASVGILMVVSLVLLAACANVANMLLARDMARQREIGIRLALGAARSRVVRQLLVENVLLALFAGPVGFVLSAISAPLLWSAFSGLLRFSIELGELDLGSDTRVISYGLVLSLLTGVLFGIAPALRSSRGGIHPGVALHGRHDSARLRGALLGTQAAVASLLLAFCGAMLSYLHSSARLYPGFESRNVYAVPPLPGLREKLEPMPGLLVAMGRLPLSGTFTPPMRVGQWNRKTFATYASDGYFETLGIRLLQGRGFSKQEADREAPVAVISESTARNVWPGRNPVGQRFSLDLNFQNRFTGFEVIGVAADARFADLRDVDPLHVYLPSAEMGGLIVRVLGNRETTLAAVRGAMESVDPSRATPRMLSNLEDDLVAPQRALLRGLAAMAGTLTLLALMLTGVGIYGVAAFLVNQRTQEIGIRMALGATARGVVGGVIVQGLRPILIGSGLGFAAAVGLTAVELATHPFPESLVRAVFGHPAVYAELGVMLAVAVLASLIPARRAARVDPIVALRYE